MLPSRPGAVVPDTAISPAARGAAVIARTPGIEVERRAMLGTDAAVGGQQRLVARDLGRPGKQPFIALGDARQQGREFGSAEDDVAPGLEPLRHQHCRTPWAAHRTGSRSIPSSRAAAIAGAGSFGPRKNIEPPAPEPAALPPSAPASTMARSRRAISGVHIPGSSAC